jgi:hypothetical protein
MSFAVKKARASVIAASCAFARTGPLSAQR